MKLDAFDRVVVMAVDSRYPDFPQRTVQLLRGHGAAAPQVFLNGRGTPRLDPSWYDMVHAGEPPATWGGSRNEHDYGMAYQEVIRRAHEGGVERLLVVEDDVEVTDRFGAVTTRAEVPGDWQLLSYGSIHQWAETPAPKVAPYVVRLNGGQVGLQALAWRRDAMSRLLGLEIDRAMDWVVARLHAEMPCYCLNPGVIRQAVGVTSAISPAEAPFSSTFIFDLE